MMSSLASVLVAKANATPEKVVPWMGSLAAAPHMRHGKTHKVDSDNQLRLGAAFARYFCCHAAGPVLRGRTHGGSLVWRRRTISLARILASWWLGRIARRTTLRWVAHGLLGRIASRRARVDGRQRARGAAMLLVGSPEAALGREGVRGRAAQVVLLVHGERGAARIRGLRRERGRSLLSGGGDGALR